MPPTTLGDLERLDKRVYDLAVQRTIEAGNEPKDEARLVKEIETFYWDHTKELYNFWDKINQLKFQPFYDLYGKEPTYTEAQIREACTEVGIHSNLIEFVINKLKENK